MKRLIFLLLAAALLLGGCGGRNETPPRPLSQLLMPDHLPDPPDLEPLPPSSVWIDASYLPRPGPKALFTRPAGDLSIFTPGGEPVYPYCAGQSQYGLCTADGVLATDPIYARITPVSNYDSYDPDGLGSSYFWEVIPHPDSTEDYLLRGAVAMDGSFATDCCYRYIQPAGEGIECIRTYGSDFDLFDRSGRALLKNLDRKAFGGDDDYWYLELREGLVLLTVYGNVEKSWFLDPDGNVVLGPYKSAAAFSEGLACVSVDGERFGYIDKSGDWALAPVYVGDAPFRDGRALQNLDGRSVLIDRAGTVLLDGPMYLMDEMYGVIRVLPEEGESPEDATRFYDRDGNLLFSGPGRWQTADADMVFTFQEQSVTIQSLRDPDRQLTYGCGGAFYPMPGVRMTGGSLERGYEIYDYIGMRRIWIREDLSDVEELPLHRREQTRDAINPWDLFYDVDETRLDWRTKEPFRCVFEKDRAAVFSDEGALLWSGPADAEIFAVDGRLGVATNRDFTYYEHDGSVSFRFPFFVETDD